MSVNDHIQEVKFNNWKHGLLDIGRRNRMINFRKTKRTTLKLISPSFSELYRRIAVNEETITFKKRVDTGNDVKLAGLFFMLDKISAPVELSTGEIASDLTTEEMGITLRNLRARARLSKEEQGINTLYLSFGFLEWRQKPEDPPLLSPLVMVPANVELSSITSPYTLSRLDEDTVLNPTLEHVLSSEYGISLPDPDTCGNDIEAFMDRIEKAVEPAGWRVIREVNLCLLSFLKIVMYKDFEKNREQIFANPVVRALCGDTSGLTQIRPEWRRFDHDSIPCEESHLVVNADASQQDAIVLSEKGVSFVLQGPPGTGKSQTITNVIAGALAEGRKVLFVSEKMAALNVVYRRLQEAGLGDYCLSLHNYKAEKKGVIQDLVRTLDAPVRELRPGVSDFLEDLEEERNELNLYFLELNKRREPLGMSIYDAITELVQLEDTAFYKVTEIVGSVSDREFRRRTAALKKLETYCRAAGTDLKNNPWRDTAITSVSYELRSYIEETLGRLGTIVFGADSVMTLADSLKGVNGADAEPHTWRVFRAQCGALHKALLVRELRARLKERIEEYFDGELVIPEDPERVEGAMKELAELKGCVDAFNALLGTDLGYSVRSLEQIRAFMELLTLSRNIPANWMTDDYTADDLRKISSSVQALEAELDGWESKLKADWEESFFDIDADILLNRFRTDYRSVLKWISGSYRADVRTVSQARKGYSGLLSDKECEAALETLRSYRELRNRVSELEKKAGGILGPCCRGRNTDWSLISGMIDDFAGCAEYDRIYGLNDAAREILCAEASVRREQMIGNMTAQEWLSSGRIDALIASDFLSGKISDTSATERSEDLTEELLELFDDYIDKALIERAVSKLWTCLSDTADRFESVFAEAVTACGESAVGDVDFRCMHAWFPGEDLENEPLAALSDRVADCSDLEKLNEWVDYAELISRCCSEGLEDYTEFVEETGEQDIVNVYRKGFLIKWIMECIVDNNITGLLRFQPFLHENTIRAFKENDGKQLTLAQAKLTEKLSSEKPSGINHMANAMDEISVLRKESEKKSRVMPLRKLFKAIPTLLMKLKPCFMMSPLSVSYFLDSDLYRFDLVIFDEASQILPEDAVGAIYRGKQVVIAGDTRQMPPTNFFNATGNTEEFDKEEEEEIYVDPDSESILDDAGACLPACTLLWHYRSKDESLIAFSNREIYNNRLITFPDTGKSRDSGLEYIYVPNGCYHDRTNVMEARRCVHLLEQHIKEHPERSLGIIAFSERQQAVIEEAVNDFRLQNPAFEGFFDDNKEEPFFVKNLENVQGDERDTIMFSICYARNSQGKMYMRFGPLGAAGGERRLNVAITRAKYNVKLVGSILPTDIDLSRTEAEGVKLLRDYIYYAMQNDNGVLSGTAETITDNRFADSVAEFIRQNGFEVRRNVGESEYKLDIAVLNPDHPGVYIAGVECDGPNYTIARTARDRDVLRQTVMKAMGWELHHVWSFNWFRNTAQEKERLLAFLRDVMQNRKASDKSGAAGGNGEKEEEQGRKDHKDHMDMVYEKDTSAEVHKLEFEEYRICDPMKAPVQPGAEIRRKLAGMIMYVMQTEAPIHRDLLYKRLAPVFGNQKVTALVKRSVDDCTANLLSDEITERGDFLYLKGQTKIRARVPAQGQEPRTIDHICPEEIRDAICEIIRFAYGLSAEDVTAETSRALGFVRTGPKIRQCLRDACSDMLDEGILIEAGGRICIRED